MCVYCESCDAVNLFMCPDPSSTLKYHTCNQDLQSLETALLLSDDSNYHLQIPCKLLSIKCLVLRVIERQPL